MCGQHCSLVVQKPKDAAAFNTPHLKIWCSSFTVGRWSETANTDLIRRAGWHGRWKRGCSKQCHLMAHPNAPAPHEICFYQDPVITHRPVTGMTSPSVTDRTLKTSYRLVSNIFIFTRSINIRQKEKIAYFFLLNKSAWLWIQPVSSSQRPISSRVTLVSSASLQKNENIH